MYSKLYKNTYLKNLCYQDKTFPVKQKDTVAVTTCLYLTLAKNLLKMSFFLNTLGLLF